MIAYDIIPNAIAVFFKQLITVILIAIVLSSCSEVATDPVPEPEPRIEDPEISESPHNILSAVVTARILHAERAFLRYWQEESEISQTPEYSVSGGQIVIPLAGLKPDKNYQVRLVVKSAENQETSSEPLEFITGSLPSNLPSFTVEQPGTATPGYVLLGMTSADPAVGGIAIVINNSGEIIWYRNLGEYVLDFQRQFNGNYTAYGNALGDPPRYFELDLLGNIINEYRAMNNLPTDSHELRLLESGGYSLLAVDLREMDLRPYGGCFDAEVVGMVVELHRNGEAPFIWNTFDHFQITDAADDIPLHGDYVDPWHGNAIDMDSDGNLLISFRNSDEIVKIDSRSGAVLWRLGGENNQFTIINDPLNGFSHQHGVRRLPNGNILLFDNGNLHSPPQSRAVEYRLDEENLVAEMVWEYRHSPIIYGYAMGYAERLPSGNTLICYGTTLRLLEVDAGGTVQWNVTIEDPNWFIYRAFRIPDLY